MTPLNTQSSSSRTSPSSDSHSYNRSASEGNLLSRAGTDRPSSSPSASSFSPSYRSFSEDFHRRKNMSDVSPPAVASRREFKEIQKGPENSVIAKVRAYVSGRLNTVHVAEPEHYWAAASAPPAAASAPLTATTHPGLYTVMQLQNKASKLQQQLIVQALKFEISNLTHLTPESAATSSKTLVNYIIPNGLLSREDVQELKDYFKKRDANQQSFFDALDGQPIAHNPPRDIDQQVLMLGKLIQEGSPELVGLIQKHEQRCANLELQLLQNFNLFDHLDSEEAAAQ